MRSFLRILSTVEGDPDASVAEADDEAAPAAPPGGAPTTPAETAPAKSPVLKVGGTACGRGCGESCHCEPEILARPAKCGRGKPLVKPP